MTKSFAIASFKPHLNYHECYLSLVVNQKLSLPLKVLMFCYAAFSCGLFPRRNPSSTWQSGCSTLSSRPWLVKSNMTLFLSGMKSQDWSNLSRRFRRSLAGTLQAIRLKSTRLAFNSTNTLSRSRLWGTNRKELSHLLPHKSASKTYSKLLSIKNT